MRGSVFYHYCRSVALALEGADHLEASVVIDAEQREPPVCKGDLVEGTSNVQEESSCAPVGATMPTVLKVVYRPISALGRCTHGMHDPVIRNPDTWPGRLMMSSLGCPKT